ncbi:autotransporter domain-containing protein [Salmonella enterica subsp. enterica]|uniref:Autotransporter domain-containing protein n=1 Tax=Salmonella enterica subsp. enterica serovar Brandenburg TaxID=149387 RepID=A0A6Y4PY72_SALET|nr:autotransporter domain-containing protein [Salmonella enterica subsp. enterica serovar Brandenburg]EEF6277383.1 autotransporter domain-containing protein [Salmonella enterica]EBQ5854688.1 autotransporter domain-containing protein [Salmonella enterica subsp. enterica serovar Brandenburg]EBR9548762.1 autotransporter domain-containing protein [Salmonella enterica subsp. enterica serovar Brandenburg]EBS6238841.1 autotransporter domain-containing protein [Salmonella enterica subsp. enterica serov
MQKKKLISIAIALTLQSYYIPAIAAENNDDEKECPSNISSLPKEKRAKLSPTCLATLPENDNHWGWVAGGVAALVAGVAIGVENNGGGDSTHSYTPPTPDNGGNVTPPDDSGDDDVTPPDDSGDDDVTPPDDSGDDDVTPPDDSGDDDVTPPDDSGDDDVTPPDDSGDDDVTPPDDSGDDDVTPPDDSGDDDDTPTDNSVTTFSNGVTIDKGKDTLAFDSFKLDNGSVLEGAVWNYSEQDDQWQLTTEDGKTLNVTGWDVTDANAAVIEGTQENGLYWKYDSRGYLIIADDNTTVITGDGESHTSDRGMDISGQDRTGVIISGDRTVNTLTGDSSVTDGATGMVISGDGTTNTISGHSTVDNAIGALISGNNTTTDFSGDITVSGGGTAIVIDGDNATVQNTGTSSISGAGSTGTTIDGNNARVSNDGDMTITDGATGGHIIGDNAVIDNVGDTTVSGAGSAALYVDGDNTLIINEGDQTISGGATGTRIDGSKARIANTGDIAVDGAGSAAVVINGDNGSLTQAGDLLVTDGAMGIITYGTGNEAKNTGNATVRDQDSVGFVVAGEQNAFRNKGNINVSLNGTGALVSGNTSQVTLDGDINVISEQDSDGVFRGATGVNVSGDSNTVNIAGNVNMSAEHEQDSLIARQPSLIGITVSGANNDIALNGALDINVGDLSTVSGQALDVTGLDITGDGNNVNIRGGIDITHSEGGDTSSSTVTGINLNGDSEVTLSGQSTIDTTTVTGGEVILARVSNGGSLILDDDSTIDINANYINVDAYTDNALLIANGENSSIANQGDITSHGVYSIMRADNGATISNSGEILIYATSNNGGDDRTAVTRANGAGSVVHNQSGGDITIISDRQPVKNYGISYFPLKWYSHTFYAMLASGYGDVVNDEDAAIHLQGAGVYGVSASRGTALNAGDIYLDGFVPTLDDEGNITSTDYWHPSSLYLTSSGMVAGSTDGDGDATATNTGTINVNNAGFGMMALNGGVAINQGTINLTADEGVTKTDDNQLVGMAALNGGTVINDTTGTINIDASYGKPFLADNNSSVINYGTVCFDSNCQSSDQYNPTDSNVSLAFADGDVITAAGETLTGETIITSPIATQTVHVTNAGIVSGGKVTVRNYGDVINEATGSISSVGIDKGGVYTNEGTTAAVSVDGGMFNNTGTVTGKMGTTVAGSIINNSGSMNAVEQWASTMNNTGTVSAWVGASGSTVLNNYSGGEIDKLNFTGAATVNNAGIINNGSVDKGGTFNNLEGGVVTLINDGLWAGAFNNWGTVNSDADIATGKNTHTLYNGSTGVINGQITTAKNNGGSKAINDGTINIDKTGNVAMSAHGSAKMVNNGEINVGTKGTTQTGMVGMQLESDAKSDAVIENNGTINIYASNSYAFSQLGSNGHIVNNGTVYIDDSVTGSGFIKQSGKTIEGSGENGDGTEVHYVDFIAPTEPTINDGMTTVTTGDSAGSSTTNNLSGYVVGTSADGSAGKLKVSNASMNGVEINTGFAAGTADTTVSFDNVVEGSNLSDAGAIQSTTVVWNAQGSQDSDGNVDVTMTKNAYADVATDASVSGVASALDAGYTNNELYTSLNVGTTAELNNALKQVSGAQATTVFREARILSNRFNMLADAAPQIKDGLAFNVVAKGDPRAELGNDTQYDMLALRQKLDLTTSQNLTLEYGIARLDGDGSKTAGDNGLTGGYSQFFGLKHSMAFEEGLAWNNSLRYDVHNLDSSRSVSYGDTNKVADSDVRQQYLEFRSEGAKTFTLMSDTLKVTPYAGVKFRHTMEDGYKERSAGDFNLSMNSGNETAVDSLVGLKLDYAGKDGWSATATLEGGPNLSYSKSQRTASLQGAAGQSFGIDDGQKGGGVNGLATIGVKYSSNDTALHLDAYQWKEDGISDKGFMLNVKKTFR